MKLIKINIETGMFIEDVIVKTFPRITAEDEEGNLTQVNDQQYVAETPVGFYHPRYVNGEWVEGLTAEEIQAIKDSVVVEPSLDERVVTIEETIDVLFGGVV